MTPEQFVSAVQQWTSAIEQSIPFFVALVIAVSMAWNKLRAHDNALNGQLDARMEETAKKVLTTHIVSDTEGVLHANSNHISATPINSSSVPVNPIGNVVSNVAHDSK